MGDKRIIVYAEVTYSADDERDLDSLKRTTRTAFWEGASFYGGTLAQFVVRGAAQDPDADPSADELPPVTDVQAPPAGYP